MHKEPPPTPLRRQAEILRLVRSRPVRSQDELQALLRRRGFAVTQPTLSRDVRSLGLARTPQGYTPPLGGPPFAGGGRRAAALARALAQGALAVQVAGTPVVCMARAIDEAGLRDVVGTIAGDDTVFIATPEAAAARRVERQLRAPVARGEGGTVA